MTANKEDTGISPSMARNAGIVAFATLASRILGFVRDAVIALLLGAGLGSDVFFLAFRIPNLMRKFFSDGVLSISFVPVFSGCLSRKGKESALEMARSAIIMAAVVSCAVALLGMLCAPWAVSYLVPGYPAGSHGFGMTVQLSRLMMPYLVCISLMAVSMGILNSFGNFAIPAVTPIVLNLVIISAALVISPHMKEPALGLAVGVTAGGVLQLVIQIPALVRCGIRLSGNGPLVHPEAVRAGRLMVPALIASSSDHINILICTFFASALASGSISHIYYAERLVQFPLALFAVSAAIVLLPEMSKRAASGDMDDAARLFVSGLELIFFITFPAMAGLAAIREPLVALLFHQGAFDATAVRETADVLLVFSMGLWAFAGTRLFVSFYMAMENRRTPMRAGICSIFLNGVLGWILMKNMGQTGVVFACVLSAGLNFFLLCYGARSVITRRVWKKIGISACRSAIASAIMAGLVFMLVNWADVEGGSKGILLITVLSCVFLGAGGYLLFFWCVRAPETNLVRQLVRRGRK